MKQLLKISMLFRRSGRSFLRFVFIGSICILTAVAIQGCDFKLKDPLGASPQVYNRLYASYLNGDTNVARGALKETVQLLQNNRSAHGQAFGLFLAYSRLYALEARVGDPDLAE